MSWWGKVIGGTFGFMLGGPLGAMMGAALGHNFDQGLNTMQRGAGRGAIGSDDVEAIQSAFFTATFTVMGHMAKADGFVSKEEIAVAENVIRQMRLNPAQQQLARALFAQGKQDGFPLNDALQQLRTTSHRSRHLMQMFLEILVATALADGNLHPMHSERIRFQRTPFIKTDYLGILMDSSASINQNSPLNDVRVRRAISYAINKEEMVAYLRNNTVFPAESGFVPPMLNNGADEKYYTYNPAVAKQLLAEAGYPNGNGMPEVVISTTSDYTDLMEYIQHELEKIGIPVRINVLQGPALREQSAKAQLAVFRKSWLADYADAENFLTVFYSPNFCPNGPNYTHYKNERFDALYRQCRTERNDSLRKSIIHH